MFKMNEKSKNAIVVGIAAAIGYVIAGPIGLGLVALMMLL